MSTKLGTLTLDLVAKIGNFIGPIQKTEQQVKVSFENMRKHVNTYGAAVAAIGASAVTALAGMAVQTANQAADLEKFAFRANSTTQEFQKMAVGAQAYGIEQEKLSDMLKDFNEKMGELTAAGGGGAKDFFERLSGHMKGGAKEAEQLILKMQKLSGPDALALYVKRLEEVGVPHQEMSFYLESMASDLTDLYPLLANGAEGMKYYADAAERAGVIMSDETIAQAKILKDQMYLLDLQMQGAKNQLMQAVIPAFVDISEAFFSGSEQGLQFTDVASGITKALKGVASVAIGVVTTVQVLAKTFAGLAAIGATVNEDLSWYEMNPLGLAKRMYEVRDEINDIRKTVDTDIHQTIMGAGDRLDKLWDSSASEATKKLTEIKNNAGKVGTGLADEIKKAEEKLKKSNDSLAKEQARLNSMVGADALKGLRIKSSESVAGGKVKGYTAEFAKMVQSQLGSELNRFTAFNDLYHKGTNSKHATGNAFDLTIADPKKSAEAAKNITEIAKQYGFIVKVLDEYKNPSSRATGGHLHVSVLGFNGKADAIKSAQDELSFVAEINSEAKKLTEERLQAQQSVMSRYFTDEQRLAYEHQQNLNEISKAFDADSPGYNQYLELEKEAYQRHLNEKNRAEKMQLLEVKKNWMSAEEYASQYYALVREEILATAEYSPEMKEILIRQANLQQGMVQNAERENVWDDYQWRFGVQKTPYQDDIDLLAEARKQMLITEEDYQKQKLNLQIAYGSAYASDFAGMLMGMVDQSGTAYRVLYGIQKGFNLAQAIMNGYTAISAAWASAPFPYNMAAVAATTMETGVLQAAIQAVTPVGMAHNGIDSIPKEGTWLLDGGERVLNPQQNKDLTRFLSENPQNAQGSGQVAIYNMLDQDELVGEYVKGRGWNVIMNQLKSNSSDVKRALGV